MHHLPKRFAHYLLLLALLVIVSGCDLLPQSDGSDTAAVDETTPQVDAQTDEPEVTVTETADEQTETLLSPFLAKNVTIFGVYEPTLTTDLSFVRDGQIDEVYVQEGDTVTAGQPLARLHLTTANPGVAAAEAALNTAKARLAELQVGPSEEEIAAYEALQAAADAQITVARANYSVVAAPANDAVVQAAEAQVAAAESERRAAEINYNRHLTEEILGDPEEIARYQLRAAEANYNAALAALDAAQGGASSQSLYAAGSAINEAEALAASTAAQLQLALVEVPEETIAVLEAEIREAEVALENALAEAAFNEEQAVITAPFDGTIVSVNVTPQQAVTQADTAFVLTDLNSMRVRSNDLDELYIVAVQPGQKAIVTFEAMGDHEYTGVIESISLRPITGDDINVGTNYSVVIALDDPDPELRWGMSSTIEIQLRD
ncbi:MAG: HlyD family efflux transporter periplasmic adaptor subunit [Anaerolineae bacterium]|nr:HlyD family efflux transporter periplasmic adaptor subunit [Anaerolineae bacterium]MCO5190656.1 HlyD family efflux transporter periplasmic adaptor subunit [Anaerolineae bacterium]MCO5193641.1 HlyD family efflux transporter periplasmic adaptor subunit [Anaerolineae bacterium]MCO5197443.1 HlyD family efflux transporter periplasmic adaptor subunit [Anaerolineae bacterium]MCO5205662.1 HlyD family efflux transporter periplasmic adaptor subunit [Anaerolineae bacterium]